MNKSSKEIHVTNNDFLLHSLSQDIYTQNDFVCECSRSDIKQNWIVCLPLLSPAYLVCGKVMFSVMSVCSQWGRGIPWCHRSGTGHMGPPPYPGPVQVCSLGITPPDLFKFVHLGTTAQPSYPYHMGNQPRHFLPTYTGISHLSPSSRSARGQKFGLDFTIYTSTKRFSLEITQTETLYLLQ